MATNEIIPYIAETGLKCDFHIHSCHSAHKETNGLTDNNTIENVSKLVNKLNDNQIEMCAITDHDVFSYDMYTALKKYENTGFLKKVFPGVEFSVALKNEEGKDVPVHIIALFDDSGSKSAKVIEEVLGDGISGKLPKYDALKHEYYSQNQLINLLDKIGMDAVFIAHQKKTITSTQKPAKNDIYAVGEKEFNAYLFSEYFQALEFHDKKNELFNTKVQNDLKGDLLTFITGSDCHDWDCYPLHDKTISNSDNFKFTYFKCLPNFRGLALALTETSRISLINSFFSADPCFLSSIELDINDQHVSIPMSKGINAIIGDNSIGKSLLLHKITNYYRGHSNPELSPLNSKIITAYDKYLVDSGISIQTSIDEDKIYGFDTQGEIRKKFSQKKLKNQEFFKSKSMANTEIASVRERTITYVESYIDSLKSIQNNEKIIDNFNKAKLQIPVEDLNAKVLKILEADTTSNNNEKIKYDGYVKIADDAILAVNKVLLIANDNEKKELSNSIKIIKEIKERYRYLSNIEESHILVKSNINAIINKFNEDQASPTDDKEIKVFQDASNDFAIKIKSRVFLDDSTVRFKIPHLEKPLKINSKKVPYGEYNIITYSPTDLIDDQFLSDVLSGPLNKGCFEEETFQNNTNLANALSRYEGDDPWKFYFNKVKLIIEDKIKEELKMTLAKDDAGKDYSSGLNDTIYFAILASDSNHSGIYLIDQPEDDVSQTSISTSLISSIKKMSKYRQVILVTHNPQFVVNLDVDNVIYIYSEDGKICFNHGALEYMNENVDILKNVADTLDGGVMTIRKRWKKYEKKLDDIL